MFGRSNEIIKDGSTIIHSEFFNHLFREDKNIDTFQIIDKKDELIVNIVGNNIDIKKYLNILKEKIKIKKVEITLNQPLIKNKNNTKVLMVVKLKEDE